MILTPTRLARYSAAFYRKVDGSPFKVDLLVYTILPAASSLADFVGSSPRSQKRITVPALYVKNVQATERTKYGFTDNVTGILYLAPAHLVQALGTFRLDPLQTQADFFSHIDNVESVSYDEDLFDTCVAVVVGLRSATNGA